MSNENFQNIRVNSGKSPEITNKQALTGVFAVIG